MDYPTSHPVSRGTFFYDRSGIHRLPLLLFSRYSESYYESWTRSSLPRLGLESHGVDLGAITITIPINPKMHGAHDRPFPLPSAMYVRRCPEHGEESGTASGEETIFDRRWSCSLRKTRSRSAEPESKRVRIFEGHLDCTESV